MPRKQRIEFAGARYHIISRGNYRKNLFADPGTATAFEKCIFEAVERCGWKLYAYVLMSNHYHLAIETPEPNLVAGMQWLQGTFATRFNRFKRESGHVFQGRYKALIVEEGRPLLGLIDYLHLNPVRARVCKLEDLKSYSLSSYPKYWKRTPVAGLVRGSMLSLLGVSDSIAGMKKYKQHLELCEEKDAKKRDDLFRNYCRGWFIGSAQAKKALAKDLADEHPGVDWEGVDMKALNQSKWERLVVREMKKLKKTNKDAATDLKGAAWKVKIAKLLRRTTTVSNVWLAERLQMGHPNRVSNAINR